MMQKQKELGPPKAIAIFVLVTMIFINVYRTTGWDARMAIATATYVVGQKGMSITDWTRAGRHLMQGIVAYSLSIYGTCTTPTGL